MVQVSVQEERGGNRRRRLCLHRWRLISSFQWDKGCPLTFGLNELFDMVTLPRDNRLIYFSLRTTEADIWLMTLNWTNYKTYFRPHSTPRKDLVLVLPHRQSDLWQPAWRLSLSRFCCGTSASSSEFSKAPNSELGAALAPLPNYIGVLRPSAFRW